jgi:hypothetical protein
MWISIWTLIALAGVVLMGASLALMPARPDSQAQSTASAPASPTAIPASGTQQSNGAVRQRMPIWLNAPKANINGPIIPVGVDAQGAMAAPEGANSDPVWFQTFWWQYGAMPGQIGNAVIAGHLDRKDGSPAIFWGLRQLAAGDSVMVRTALGGTLHFVVTAVQTFANTTGGADDSTLQRIFGPAKTANLNLITCAGDWTGKEYNKKLVIFTTLIP